MKNIILTASLVTNAFIGIALYGFTTGHIARPATEPADYVSELAARPVHLSRN